MSILRCIAIAASGAYAVLCSISGPTLAQVARSGQPSLTATEAFGQYAAIQDKIRPSFVLKTRVTYEDRGSFFQGTKTCEAILDVSYRDCGAEGNRVKLREEGWGEFGHLTVAQETPEYRSWLWDGRNYMRYTGPPKRQAGLPGARSGSVFAYMSGTGEITDRRLTSRLWGSPLMGYFPSADEPFDKVLRQMPEASWAYRLEQVGGVTCHMIEAATRHGRYKVWLDPEHGYNVARAELSLQAGRRQFICDQPFDKYGKERSWSVENVRFQRREGLWFPSEADTYDYLLLDDAGRFVATRTHIEVTDLTVNPDHAALHSFTSDDIPDGPGVLGYVDLNEGLYTAWDPHYHWQNGAEFVVDRASHRIKYQNGTELLPVVKVIPPLRELEIKIDPTQVRGKQILLCFCDLTQPSSQQTVLQLCGRAGLLQRDDLFVGLLQCSKDDPDSIEKWLRDNRIPFPIGALWQITDKVLRAWGVQELPWLVLSDENHVVTDEGFGLDDLGRRLKTGKAMDAPSRGAADSVSPRVSSGPRVLHFPADRSLGRLMIRPTMPQPPEVLHRWATYDELESLGQAQGSVTIPAGHEAALIVNRPQAWRDLSSLRQLRPDDLYRLDIRGSYFGGAKPGDSCMQYVAGLTGLRVLDLSNTSITSAGLRHIVALKSLQQFLPPPLMDDTGMVHVAQLPSLTSLHFGENRLTDEGLLHLSKLGSLTELCLGGGRITDDGLAHLAQAPRLRYLMLWGKNFTDAGLRHLRGASNLQALHLGALEQISDAGLVYLAEIAPLQELDLYEATRITNDGIAVLKKLPDLRRLTIAHAQVMDAGLAHLKAIKTLESLRLPDKDITDAGFRYLAELPRLRELDVPRPHYVDPNMNKNYYTDEGLKAISGLASLEKLDVGGIGITDVGVRHLGRLTHLKQLQLFGCDRITNDGLKTIGQMSSLENLHVSFAQVSISGLKALNSLTNLKTLDVKEVIPDGSVLDLSGLKSLEKLTIGTLHRSTTVLQDEDLACLANLTRLRWFQISQAVDKAHALTDRGLAHLSGLVNMDRLTLGGPELSDAGLAHLAGMKKLDMLNIYGGEFTDRGLANLEQLTGLTNLKLFGGHHFSQPAIHHLFEALPELNYIQVGMVWPGERVLREKVLASSYTTRPGIR